MGRVAHIMADETGDDVSGLMAKHGLALRKYLARILKSAQDTADVVQETTIRLLRRSEREAIEEPEKFLYRVATNAAYDHLRRRKNSRWETMDWEAEQVPDSQADPERQTIDEDLLRRSRRIAEEMPARRREIFIRHYFNGEPRVEIAAALGISRITVDQQLRLGLAYCLRRLQEPIAH